MFMNELETFQREGADVEIEQHRQSRRPHHCRPILPAQTPKSSSSLGEGPLPCKDLLIHRAIINAKNSSARVAEEKQEIVDR